MRDNQSVIGPVTCEQAFVRVCVPGRVHRLDPDLELCVCKECGNGWIRDVDPWQKLQESFERLNQTLNRLAASTKSLEKSLTKLNDALKGKKDV